MAQFALLESFTVIIDANALMGKNKAEMVINGFEETIKECRALADIRLYIPQVVLGERCYQLVQIAEQEFAKAANSLATVTRITGALEYALPMREAIKAAIQKRFEQWALAHDILQAETPIKDIDWQRVVDDSVWRNAPFEPNDADKKEKGFRDYMILETAKSLAKSSPGRIFVFVSNDALLKQAVKVAVISANPSIHDDLTAFLSFLKLKRQSLTDEFSKRVSEFAGKVFYTEGDPSSVYQTLDVQAAIMRSLTPALLLKTETNILGSRTALYKVIDHRVRILATEFVQLEGEVYHWKTKAEYELLLRPVNSPSNEFLPRAFAERLEVNLIEILWQSTVSRDVKFENFKLGSIARRDTQEELAWLKKQQYGFSEDSMEISRNGSLGTAGWTASPDRTVS